MNCLFHYYITFFFCNFVGKKITLWNVLILTKATKSQFDGINVLFTNIDIFCAMKLYFIMQMSSNSQLIFPHTTILLLTTIQLPIVIAIRQSLFASLSQLQLLWHNDIHIVKIMEHILETASEEYRPLQRFVIWSKHVSTT